MNRPRHTKAEGKALVTNKQLTDWLVVQQQHLGFSLVPQFAADWGPARRQSVPVDLDKFEDWFEVAAIFISRVFLLKIQDLYPLHPISPRSKVINVSMLVHIFQFQSLSHSEFRRIEQMVLFAVGVVVDLNQFFSAVKCGIY